MLNRHHLSRIIAIALSASFLVVSLSFAESDADKEKKRQEILEKMEKLRQQKEKVKIEEREKVSKIDANSSRNRRESIALFEKIISATQRGESKRCDAFFQLGALYYEDERDLFNEKTETFKKDYELWEKRGSQGNPPVEAVPTYGKSREAFESLLDECTDFKGRDVVLYKLGNIYTQIGDFENAFKYFSGLLKEYPKSENAPFAHLRIGEYYYMNRDNANALKHYLEVGMTSGADNYLLSLYRIASCYYNMSRFEDAIDKFFEYVEMADSGKFPRADFRDEAVEYLAISFSEMEGGAEKALKFFEKKGGRSYQDVVIYTIGAKNRDHDNVPEAIKSLNFLLDHSPNYIEAPVALKALIDCYILEKKYEKAIELRERMIKNYGPGSQWMNTYAGEKQKIATTLEYIKEAGAIIPIYYNKLGNMARDSGKIDKAKAFYNKALAAYDDYIQKFPDEKWNVYTFHFFKADLMSDTLINRFDEAAKEFEWVSQEDTTTYPSRIVDQKKLQEEKRKENRDIKDQFKSDIKEQVATVGVNPEEAAFAAVVCRGKVAQKALKAQGFTDSTAYKGTDVPEMKTYLEGIRAFRNRFPLSKHSAEMAYLEASLYFDAKDFPRAIEGYKFVIGNFQNDEKLYKSALEFLARAYMSNKQYEEAITIHKRLMNEINPTAAEKTQLTESIAATLFMMAEARQKSGDYSGAADFYKQIVIDYPTFSRAERALFNAAYAYEQGKLYSEAAREFERVFDRFPKFDRRKEAIFRAAVDYAAGGDYVNAAGIYLKYAKEMPRDTEAVPSIFRAAAMYDSANDYVQAAKTYEKVFELAAENKKDKEMYPRSEAEAPGALYSAGLLYEKANNYQGAISEYEKLEKSYPNAEITAEAVYSIAICWEKLNDDAKMAAAYINFTEKYGVDQAKVVLSLQKAAKAYERLERRADQDKMYRTIIKLYQEYGKKFQIDERYPAEAYFTLGAHAYENAEKIDLRTPKMGAAGQKEIESKLKLKTDALQEPIKFWTDCIALGTDEWTTRATYMCGEAFWNLMEAVKSQPITEKDPDKIAYSKVKINEMLISNQYYERALNYYQIIVKNFRNQQGVKNEWTDKSADRYAQGWYQMCFSNIENGETFAAAPNPFPKGTQEYDEYQANIQSVVDKLSQKCIPCFEEGIKSCLEMAIDNSWVERMRKELVRQAPSSEALKLKAAEAPKTEVKAGTPETRIEKQFEQKKRAIENIYASEELSVEKKISILQGMESSAKRQIDDLNEEISKLKAK